MRRSVCLFVSAVVVVSACAGGSDGDTSPSSSGESATTTDAEPAPTSPTLDTSPPPASTDPGQATSSAPPSTAPSFPAYESTVYGDTANWLCHPDDDADPCDGDSSVASVDADGSVTTAARTSNDDAPVDCFYVYPTTSEDGALQSDLVAGNEAFAAIGQVRPFNSLCRVYAPMYRSVTLAGLNSGFTGEASFDEIAEAWSAATADVEDAWRHYLANLNNGRGVILIGHSQGAGHLTQLLDSVIDPDPAQRSVLISAYIMGGSVAVPEGADVGGLLADIPLCRERGQTGCVVTYSTYEDVSPAPADAFFGRPAPLFVGGAALDGTVVAGCVNPADLGGPGDAPATLRSAFPAGQWEGDPIDSAYVGVADAVTAQCVLRDGLSYLEVSVDRSHPQIDNLTIATLDPKWGLHVVDVTLAADSLYAVAEAQIDGFLNP